MVGMAANPHEAHRPRHMVSRVGAVRPHEQRRAGVSERQSARPPFLASAPSQGERGHHAGLSETRVRSRICRSPSRLNHAVAGQSLQVVEQIVLAAV